MLKQYEAADAHGRWARRARKRVFIVFVRMQNRKEDPMKALGMCALLVVAASPAMAWIETFDSYVPGGLVRRQRRELVGKR